MEIMQALQWRYATKMFDANKKLSEADFQKLLDALVLTPSSFGLQPWKFVVVENPELRAQLRPHSWGQSQITDASHLLVLCRVNTIDEAFIQKNLDQIVKIRGVSQESLQGYKEMMIGNLVTGERAKIIDQWARNQVYIALGNLMTVAAALEIDACPIEGFDANKYDEILDLKKYGLSSCVVLPVGYRSEEDKYQQVKKVRFEKKDLVITM